ncbi:Aldo-keto reductase family 1 member B10 [Apostichopus japonicus]|uniref:Aldo-keto reductase family 1 member B10 n=1 Tax=Stichopus japonicus TaxID=307972 RepID=A0A2G8KYT9_STIJA|nr:Aldo-keto reductase family 1 member B10 [Apostichopus japonicus]
MPLLGLGTWKSKPNEVKGAVRAAIRYGYRHIDCAYEYENEKDIGETLKELFDDGTIKREDVFITTKLWGIFHRPDRVEYAMNLSLKALQLDYVDLYLMHSPMAFQHAGDTVMYPPTEGNPDRVLNDDVDYLDTWKAMESLVGKGLTKSIGVSNFNTEQLGKLMNIAKVPCVNNQIENHPCLEQAELINFCKANNITVTSYSPLGSPDRSDASDKDPNLREDPVVLEMAKAKRCTPVQLLIAYHLNQGLICIPKSKSTKRIEENFMSLDVNLSEDEIKKLDGLSCSYRALHWDL